MIAKKLKDITARLLRTEFVLLAVLGITALAIWSFAGLVDDVMENELHAFDQKILLALRHADNLAGPFGPAWLHAALLDFTSLGSTAVLSFITLCALVYLWIDKKHAAAGYVLLAVGGGALLVSMLKFGFQRPRPDLVPHLAEVTTYSFPSGHAAMATITYLTLGTFLARVQKKTRMKVFILSIAVFLSLTIGFSRVYLGVHWPTDVLAGWSLGTAWAMLCWLIARWLQVHGKMESGGKDA